MKALSVEWQLLADRLLECSMTVGRSKSTELAQTVLRTPILASMVQLGGLLGRLGTKNSSLTQSQKKAGQALEVLASNLWVKLAEAHGAEKTGHALTHIHCKKN
jgi:hypothetical protein